MERPNRADPGAVDEVEVRPAQGPDRVDQVGGVARADGPPGRRSPGSSRRSCGSRSGRPRSRARRGRPAPARASTRWCRGAGRRAVRDDDDRVRAGPVRDVHHAGDGQVAAAVAHRVAGVGQLAGQHPGQPQRPAVVRVLDQGRQRDEVEGRAGVVVGAEEGRGGTRHAQRVRGRRHARRDEPGQPEGEQELRDPSRHGSDGGARGPPAQQNPRTGAEVLPDRCQGGPGPGLRPPGAASAPGRRRRRAGRSRARRPRACRGACRSRWSGSCRRGRP